MNFIQPINISARWCVIAMGFAIPLSTALDNLLLLILLLVVIGNARSVWHCITHNPVARASSLLFAALLLGMVYGGTAPNDAAGTLGKYVDLAFVPLLMVAARDAETRRRAMLGFLAAMLVTAVLSWLVGLSILPRAEWMWGLPENPAIFRSSITQSVLMAYAAFLLALQAREESAPVIRWLLAGMAALAGGNVLFMVGSRTGYLVLLALLAYFSWTMLARRLLRHGNVIGWREGMAVGLLALLLVFSAYQVSPRLHDRVNLLVAEFKAWQPDEPNATSTGVRLSFYYNTFALIKQHPLLGVGTGGFSTAYAQHVQDKDLMAARNPHNEYLLIAVQTGAVGLGLLLYLFYTQWGYAAKLAGVARQDAARGLVLTIAITCLFNAPLLDHTEGLFFAFMSALLFANFGSKSGNE